MYSDISYKNSGQIKRLSVVIGVASIFLLGGCTHATEPDFPSEGFGSSVKQLIRGQIFSTSVRPAYQPVTGIDGQKAEAVMKAYRNSSGKPERVGDDVGIKPGK